MIAADYRPISSFAVASFAVSVASVLAFFALPLVALAVFAAPVAGIALHTIRRHELGGSRFVRWSLGTSAVVVLLAPVWHESRYRSEALPRHDRINFAAVVEKTSAGLDELAGRTICLKGYALTPTSSLHFSPMRSFQFSPNGDLRNVENAITVDLPFEWEFKDDPIAVSGTLVVNRDKVEHAERYVFKASGIRMAKTPQELAPRAPGGGC